MDEQIRDLVGDSHADRVHFLGHVTRETVIACMNRADVFAFPSKLEALPLVVLEAMSCGLPIVCSSTAPGPEMIQDGVNGLLADPDHAHEWSKQILTLLDDTSLASRLASNALQSVAERFSLERCIQETETFYQHCMSS